MNPRLASALAMTLFVAMPAVVSADAFIANNVEISTGGVLALLRNGDAPRTDAGYLAAVIGGSIFFIDESGALRPYRQGEATPKRTNGLGAGWQTLFTYALPEKVELPVTFYSAFGKDNVDLLGTPGALDAASVQGVRVQFWSRAINNERWGDGPNGGTLYNTNCAGCHDGDPVSNRNNINRGRDGQAIRNAIAADKGGMGYLKFLGVAETSAIAEWIKVPTFDCH